MGIYCAWTAKRVFPMLKDEEKLMIEIFGKIVSEKELEEYLNMEDETRQQELETYRDIVRSTR